MKFLKVPIKKLDNDTWLLLNHFSRDVVFRFHKGSKIRRVKDPSGHRINEISVSYNVKCRFKSEVNIAEMITNDT